MTSRRAAALFILLAAFHTWPLASAPWRLSLNHNADAQQCAWTICWVARTLPTAPARLFDANIFAPEPATLAYSEPMVTLGVLAMPVWWLGESPVLAFNLVVLAGLVLSAWSGYAVTARWTGDRHAALVAGALVAFTPHLLTRLPHAMAAHTWGIVFSIYFADRMAVRATRRDGVLLALAVLGTAATSIYWLALAGVGVGIVLAVHAARGRWRGVLATAAAATAGLVAALPVLWPYLGNAAAGIRRPLEAAAEFSVEPSGYLSSLSRLHAGWSQPFFRDEVNVFFPGIAATGLAAVGVAVAVRSRGARWHALILVVLAAAGFVLSLGPATGIYRVLYEWVLSLQGLRAPARFGYLVLLAIALAAGFGVAWLNRRTGRPVLVTTLALIVVSAEVTQMPIRTAVFDGIPPIYDVVASAPGPVLLVEVPFFPPDAVFENGEYVLNAAGHWRPLMNGTSGLTPMSYRRRAESFWFFPEEHAIEAMRREGATHVMVHLDRFVGVEVQQVERALLGRTDLRLIAADARGHRLYRFR